MKIYKFDNGCHPIRRPVQRRSAPRLERRRNDSYGGAHVKQRRLFLALSIAIVLAGWTSQSDHWHWFDSTPLIESGIRELTWQITATTVLETAILGLLLRGAGEGFAGIGLGFRELAIAARNPLVLRVIGALLLVSLVIDNVQLNLAKHGTRSAMVDNWLREPPVAPVLHGWLDEPNGLFWMLVFLSSARFERSSSEASVFRASRPCSASRGSPLRSQWTPYSSRTSTSVKGTWRPFTRASTRSPCRRCSFALVA